MTRAFLITLSLALAIAAFLAAAARPGVQPAVIDFGNCDRNGSTATVAAGVPIDVAGTGGFATGTYGTTLHAGQTATATATISVTGGSTTTLQLHYSKPYFDTTVGAWVSSLPDIQLAALPAGGSVNVVVDQTNTAAHEYVFPGQHFGPFHDAAGETFEAGCLISAP